MPTYYQKYKPGLKYRSYLETNIQESKQPNKIPLTKEDIEAFIQSDLQNASLKSIKEKYQTNNVQLYSLLDPEKPGELIHRLRMETIQKLRSEGASAKEVAQSTGLSESYIRQIWKKIGKVND